LRWLASVQDRTGSVRWQPEVRLTMFPLVPGITLVLALTLAGTACAREATLSGRRLAAPGWSLELPADDWTLHTPTNSDADAEATSPTGAYAVVLAEETAVPPIDLARRSLQGLKEVARSLTLTEKRTWQAPGLTGVVLTLQAHVDGVGTTFRNLYATSATHAYQVICWTPAAAAERERASLDRLIHSFRAVTPTPQPGARIDGRILRSPALGARFVLPSDAWWLPPDEEPRDPEDDDVVLESRAGGHCLISGTDHDLDTDTTLSLYLETLRRDSPSLNVLSRTDLTVAGRPATQVRAGSAPEGGAGVEYLLTFVRGERRSYQISCWADPAEFPAYEADFQSLVRSFGEDAE
jgi:hypothetical protein